MIIYHAPWFFLVQFIAVIHIIMYMLHRKPWQSGNWPVVMIHGALIIMLFGAMLSHIFSKEGSIHLREGDISDRMVVHSAKGEAYHLLPFRVELEDFILERYPGSSSPSSFESRLIIYNEEDVRKERVFMNNVVDVGTYRLFQASFDRDEKGTILAVNRDPLGRNVTYFGYGLLFAGLIANFFARNSRFQKLRRALHGHYMMLILLLPVIVSGKEMKQVPDADHARRFGALAVQSTSGRLMPVNTLASEILRKVHRKEHVRAFTADQFLVSVMTMPEMWARVPFIVVPGKRFSYEYGLSYPYCAYMDVFGRDGEYKYQEEVERAYGKSPARRTRMEKDLIVFDERIHTLHQLFHGGLIRIFPDGKEEEGKWYAWGDDLSEFKAGDSAFVRGIMRWYVEEVQEALHGEAGAWEECDKVIDMIRVYQEARSEELVLLTPRLKAELVYNRVNPFKAVRKAYLILGLLLLVVSVTALFRGVGRRMKAVVYVLTGGVMLAWVGHLGGMGLRGYIAGNAPWSNAYETMVFAAAAVVAAGLYFCRRNTLVFALATLFAGVILFVSGLSWMDPQINPLVPVLKSPWLMTHVSVIMTAYGFFGLSTVASVAWLCVQRVIGVGRKEELTIITEMSLHIGLALMTIGTFLGAIWANESWGRYWGWDPKETWALITIVSYAALLHLRFTGFRNPRLFHILTVLAFTTVLMTYFGVNYWLSGMHSYK